MSQFTHDALLADLNTFPRVIQPPTVDAETKTPVEKQPTVDQAYLTMLQTQNMMCQQALLTQQNNLLNTTTNAGMQPLQIGDPYAKPSAEKKDEGSGMGPCCKGIMVIASVILFFYAYTLNNELNSSQEYQAFSTLNQYVNEIEEIPEFGDTCAEYIAYGYQTLYWTEGMIALGLIGGILTCVAPVVTLVGGVGFSFGAYYYEQQVNGNECSQYWSTIVTALGELSNDPVPGGAFAEMVYQNLAAGGGLYTGIILIGVLALHCK